MILSISVTNACRQAEAKYGGKNPADHEYGGSGDLMGDRLGNWFRLEVAEIKSRWHKKYSQNHGSGQAADQGAGQRGIGFAAFAELKRHR